MARTLRESRPGSIPLLLCVRHVCQTLPPGFLPAVISKPYLPDSHLRLDLPIRQLRSQQHPRCWIAVHSCFHAMGLHATWTLRKYRHLLFRQRGNPHPDGNSDICSSCAHIVETAPPVEAEARSVWVDGTGRDVSNTLFIDYA